MNIYLQPVFFLCLVLFLFFVSRKSTILLYQFLVKIFRNKKFACQILAIVYFPGTVIHELSHFLAATLLFLKVQDISVFPEIDGDQIKLGKVLYEKKDFFRGLIVGIAPIFVGLALIFWLNSLGAGSNTNLLFRFIFFYLVFVISTSMFSSKQDLVDIIYIIPLVIVFLLIIFIFNIDLHFQTYFMQALEGGENFLYALNNYLKLSVLLHLLFLLIVNIYFYLSK